MNLYMCKYDIYMYTYKNMQIHVYKCMYIHMHAYSYTSTKINTWNPRDPGFALLSLHHIQNNDNNNHDNNSGSFGVPVRNIEDYVQIICISICLDIYFKLFKLSNQTEIQW